ncbi:MAG: hypothetical protein WBZ20_07065 [Nitrososphaeraceae archaeon]
MRSSAILREMIEKYCKKSFAFVHSTVQGINPISSQNLKKGIEPNGLNLPVKVPELVIEFRND